MLVSIVEHCLMPPNWLEWMKFDATECTWSLLLIAFSINFPSVLRSIIGWKTFGMSYKGLFGLEMMINNHFLKWVG